VLRVFLEKSWHVMSCVTQILISVIER
jgi:hypothetical protein